MPCVPGTLLHSHSAFCTSSGNRGTVPAGPEPFSASSAGTGLFLMMPLKSLGPQRRCQFPQERLQGTLTSSDSNLPPQEPNGGAGSWAEATQLPMASYVGAKAAGKPARVFFMKTFLPRCLLSQFPHLSIHSHSPSAPSCFLQIKTPRLPARGRQPAGSGAQERATGSRRPAELMVSSSPRTRASSPGESPWGRRGTSMQLWLQRGLSLQREP